MKSVYFLISFIVWSLLLFFFYWPGQYGVLVLDDIINLSDLQWIGKAGISDPAFWTFVSTGRGGPTGRPVSMFSFALQAQCWPDQIQCFKIFNIVLHYLSACLVFCTICLFFKPLGRIVDSAAVKSGSTGELKTQRRKIDWLDSGALTKSQLFYLAFFVSLIWALHPLQTSAVLYTIQRMALLSNFFILLGLNFWLALRVFEPCRQGALRIVCLLGVIFAWILATFSKENGLLLVVYILLIDYCWASMHAQAAYQRLKLSALFTFWGAIFVFPLIFPSYIARQYAVRDFTLIERLLTQSRLMFDYLYAVVQPSRVAGTVFSDVVTSTSIVSPISTLTSICGLVFLVVVACLLRRRLPILFLAIFWFLNSHALESTVLALEMYFIHRNYLAILGPILLIAYLGLVLLVNQPRFRSLILVIAVLISLLFGWQVRQIAHIWNDSTLLAKEWYRKLPNSDRAKSYYAFQLASRQGEEGAAQANLLYEELNHRYPGKPNYWLMRIMLGCHFQNIELLDLGKFLQTVGPPLRANMQGNSLTYLDQFITLNQSGECGYSASEMQGFITGLPIYLENDDMHGVRHYFQARVWRYEDTEKTLGFYKKAIKLSSKHIIRHSYARYALQQNQPELAQKLIEEGLEQLASLETIEEGSKVQIQTRYQQLINKLPDK